MLIHTTPLKTKYINRLAVNITIRQRKKYYYNFCWINDNTFIIRIGASLMPKLSRVFAWHGNILRYYLILMEFNQPIFTEYSYITAGLAVIWLAYLCAHWVVLHVFVLCTFLIKSEIPPECQRIWTQIRPQKCRVLSYYIGLDCQIELNKYFSKLLLFCQKCD